MSEVHGSELASFARRAAAFLIDLAIAAGLFSMVASIAEPLLVWFGSVQRSGDLAFQINMNWYSIAWIVLYFGVAAFFGNGKTPGKWILGIRIVSLSHEKINLWPSLERAFGYGYSLLEFCFGFIQYFIYPNRRTLHDRIAETIVVRERKKETIETRAG